jgi:hypothetical protein
MLLLSAKCRNSIVDTVANLGKSDDIGRVFSEFQRYLLQ